MISFLRDTKKVGELSELVVAMELARAGYLVAKPLGDNQRYDLIIDDGSALSRVQVKTGRLRKGAVIFNCYSVSSAKSGRLRTYFGAAEYFGVYCPDVRSVYLVPVGDVPRTCSGALRWSEPKNRQNSKVRWADQYLVSNVELPRLFVVGAESVDGVTPPRTPS